MAGSTRDSKRATPSDKKDDVIARPEVSDIPVQVAPVPDNPVSVITAAMLGVMMAVGNVEKNAKNSHFNYNYATEGDILARIRPEMIKQGLILIPTCEELRVTDASGNVFILMAYTLAHVSGVIWPHKVTFPGCGNDKSSKGGSGDKGVYKALTGANKYALLKLFQIATGNDPEEQDLGHTEETAGLRPQGQAPRQQQRGSGGGQGRKTLSMREEDDFRAVLIADMKRARSRNDIADLFTDETKDKIEMCSRKSRDEIEKVKRQRWDELKGHGDRGGGERQRDRDIPVSSGRRDEGGPDNDWPGDDRDEDRGRDEGDGGGYYGTDNGDEDNEDGDRPPL